MIRRLARLVLAVAAIVAWAAGPALAVVTLSNGNFNTEFTDVAAPGALGMKIDRVYNSKADFTGMFGSRWSVQYEEYLQIEDDGSIVVHEYGGGFANRFAPVTAKPRSLNAICDELTTAAEKLGLFASTKEKEAYRAWVVDHHESEFEKFWELGLVKTPYLGIGQEFRSRRFGNEVLSSVPEGYQRSTDAGTFEEFNLKGKLVRVWDANHNFIALRYNAKGQLATMEDSGGNRFVFTFNDQNHVASIAWGTHVAHYEYKGSYLAKSVSSDGHTNLYQYETQYPYYLTQIHYSDGTDQKIAYYALEDEATVKDITERDGSRTSYQYDRSIDDRYAVTVTSTDSDKKIVVNKYEYYYGHTPSGDLYNSRMVQSLNGDVTDSTYNQDHEPMSITKNGVTTRFAYDDFGHVTLKQTATETTKLTYDPTIGKVTSVTTIAGDKTSVVSFVYDAKGNIVEATDPAGHDVALTYDDNGHIATMTEKTTGTMRLVWDRDSRLVKVVVDGVGSLDVVYKENGDFEKETSDDGNTVLQKIDAMYGAMIRMIKPPVVPLTF
jgi:YD repeat-containing protein